MELKETYAVSIGRNALWEILMDVHQVAECLEGVEELNIIEDDHYEGRLAVKMGPIRLRFSGTVTVTLRDYENYVGTLEATAKDPKAGGGFKATLQMQATETSASTTDLAIVLNTTFLGKIGELGRPLIKKKINSMTNDFVHALTETVSS